MAYIVYQIWLSKNSLVFDAEVVPFHRVLDRAIILATEYHRLDTTVYLLMSRHFGTLMLCLLQARIIFIS